MFDPTKVIIGPIISEKSIGNTASNRYTFQVTKDATKASIEKAVTEIFKVEVLEVKVINIRGKKVRFGRKRIPGKKEDKRKAVVTIKAGQKIEIFDLGQDKKGGKVIK